MHIILTCVHTGQGAGQPIQQKAWESTRCVKAACMFMISLLCVKIMLFAFKLGETPVCQTQPASVSCWRQRAQLKRKLLYEQTNVRTFHSPLSIRTHEPYLHADNFRCQNSRMWHKKMSFQHVLKACIHRCYNIHTSNRVFRMFSIRRASARGPGFRHLGRRNARLIKVPKV